ncbi:adenosine receptor A2b-like [Stylophora pistillata]|uniref:adenosine receptor A2b-like n=1 Tax=Stylophora pistillata TaxID=50429 RepID=UPI000C056799|nr:adenosine receptor A2b-like [Stylophora pistillata]
MMSMTNVTEGETQEKTFEELLCSPALVGGLQQESILFSAVNILLSITAFFGNFLILVALYKDSSLHPPSKLLYRCLATTDLLVGLVAQPLYATYCMSLVYARWNLCQYVREAVYVTGYALCKVSLLTMTAISLDRLLALLLGLRHRQIVTLRRTYIMVASFWVLSSVIASSYTLDYSVTFFYGRILMPTCIIVSFASYAKIFHTLSQHQAQVQDQFHHQTSHPNISRYKKAANSALWVQLALVICYLPFGVVDIVISNSKIYSSLLVIVRGLTVVLVFFNSTLNPLIYCWKISEVRQAVKQTIRRALC